MNVVEMFRATTAALTGFLFGRLQDTQGFAPRCIYVGLLVTVITLFIISFVARVKP